jgi:hypothetical protein
MTHRNFSVSIVSHGHKEFVLPLLNDLATLGRSDFDVILTLNIVEYLEIDCGNLPFPVTLIKNRFPKGFAANHNTAFATSHGDYFVILNPDIRMVGDPFNALLTLLQQNPNSICAPIVVNRNGGLEDSARNFPTPAFLVKKFLSKTLKAPRPRDFVAEENSVSMPDWIAGMFIVVPRDVYQNLHGLDERYRMYYEDVDFCARARLAGYKVLVNGHVKAIHEAQRESHRNLRYLAWHLRSALRFFTSKAFLKIQLHRLLGSSRLI